MIGKVIYYKLRLWNEETLVPHYTTQAAKESQRWNYIYNNSILDAFGHHAHQEHWLKLGHLYEQSPTEDMETLIEYLPIIMEEN